MACNAVPLGKLARGIVAVGTLLLGACSGTESLPPISAAERILSYGYANILSDRRGGHAQHFRLAQPGSIRDGAGPA